MSCFSAELHMWATLDPCSVFGRKGCGYALPTGCLFVLMSFCERLQELSMVLGLKSTPWLLWPYVSGSQL